MKSHIINLQKHNACQEAIEFADKYSIFTEVLSFEDQIKIDKIQADEWWDKYINDWYNNQSENGVDFTICNQ